MKNSIYFFLNRMFGKKRYYRFFIILRNIGMQGLNYRNTNISSNGELFLIHKIAAYLKNKNVKITLFDVGANVGNYSKALADTFTDDCTIYSFEPFSIPFIKLKKLSTSYLHIKPYQIGFSNKNENLTIYSSDEFSEIGGVYNRDYIFKDIPHDIAEVNRFMTIDSFCQENSIDHIHFLKIDVEGHELAVLEGSISFLKNNQIDIIQFEFGAGNHFSRTYFIDFFKLLNENYRVYLLLRDGLVEIEQYTSEYEAQSVINFVAVNNKISESFLKSVND